MSIRLAIVDSVLFEELLDVGYYVINIEEQDNGQAVAEMAREF